MPTEIVALLGNLISQAPLVALFAYGWYQDRKDKTKQIEFLRKENIEKADVIEKFVASMDRLAMSLELIKDRLR